MKLHYDTATEDFRAELREWLDENQPAMDEMRAEPQTRVWGERNPEALQSQSRHFLLTSEEKYTGRKYR